MSKYKEVKENAPPLTNHQEYLADRLPAYFLQNSVLVGWWLSIFPRLSSQVPFIKPSNRNSRREVGWFFSPRQIDASHPAVTIPASFSSWFPERSERCRNKDALLLLKLCPIVLVSCHCGRQHFLTPVNYRRGTPYLLKSLSRCYNFQPLALLCYDHSQLYWSHKCTKDISIYFYIATLNIFIWANLTFHQPPKTIQAIYLKTASSSLIR